MNCPKCENGEISIVPDSDNLDGSIPYKHHLFCENCGHEAEIFKLKEIL